MHRLSFCSIHLISDKIVEVIFDSEVDISLAMVNECWDFIDKKMLPPIAVLLNKKHSYSYQFDAMLAFSESTKIDCIAAVSYSETSTSSAEYMKTAFNKSAKRIEIFSTREAALKWIESVVGEGERSVDSPLL